MSEPLRIGLVAGEVSGDQLGADLITALRARLPDARFLGVTGEGMRRAGCETLARVEELSVMGLVEPLRHLPRLFALRRRLRRTFLQQRVDLFVGIDSPAFNLGLAGALRRRGVVTAQYVSPQVWAWRRGRVPGIARAVDAVLCLLPFEPAAYAGHPVRAEFVGHPLADRIVAGAGREAARASLGLAPDACVVALLPGSRAGEIERLGGVFAEAAARLAREPGRRVRFVAPMVSDDLAARFARQVVAAGADVHLVRGQADAVLASADAALVASGTATLQTLLHGVPMVVAYRLAPLTAFLVRDLGLVKLRHFSLPNLLAGEALVPEFFQEAAQPGPLATALAAALDDPALRGRQQQRFLGLHAQLARGGAASAAQVLLEVLAARSAVLEIP